MENFVRACAIYNLGGVGAFLTPGVLPVLGVSPPHLFWLVLPSLFGTFAAIVLWISARDLKRFASLPYWNGIIRLTFVVLVFALGFGESVGRFVTWLALGDLVLALGAIFGLAQLPEKRHLDLLTGR
jgi:hypothetical protein